jgi:hypothetical protein
MNWKSAATTDEGTIRRWWSSWPDANVGLVTGWPDGPGVVLDVDDRSLLEELPEPIRCDRATWTGKDGWHLFFALPEGVEITNAIGNLPKGRADVRGSGSGYVLAPPSIHPNGNPYRWCKESPAPTMMPEWLLATIRGDRPWSNYAFNADTIPDTPAPAPTPALERARLWLQKAEPAIQGSGGQSTLFTVASHLAGFGLSAEDAADLLWSEFNPRCVPPWQGAKGERQFRRHVREGHSKGPVAFGSKLDNDLDAAVSLSPGSSPKTPASRSSSAAPHGQPWGEPDPLPTGRTLPRFPITSLPSWAEEWADSVAEATQTPPELAGMLALVSAAAALAKKVVVRVKRGWIEPLALWVVVAMAPSSRKSPVFSAATSPLAEYEQQRAADLASDIAMANHELDVEVARLKALKARAAKVDAVERDDLLDQIERQQRRVDAITIPVAERLLAQDATTESLVGLMASNGGKIAVMSDEGGILGIAAGRYTSGRANVDALLQGYSGGDIRVDRRGREPEFVKKAALTLGLTVQVEVLREVFSDKAMRGRGLLARPLYVVPKSNVGERRSALGTPEVPESLSQGYRSGLLRLCGLPTGVEPVELRLSSGAREILEQWDQRLEQELRDGGRWHSVSEWAGKLVGGVIRIAGILHVSESGLEGEIDESTTWRAIALGDFLLKHAAYAFDTMRDDADGLALKAKKVLDWLGTLGTESVPTGTGRVPVGTTGTAGTPLVVKRHKIHASKKRLFSGAAEMDAALGLLVEYGWLRETRIGSARAFEVHPSAADLERLEQVGTAIGTASRP